MSVLRWCLQHPFTLWGLASAGIALAMEATLRHDASPAVAAPLWGLWWASAAVGLAALWRRSRTGAVLTLGALSPWTDLGLPEALRLEGAASTGSFMRGLLLLAALAVAASLGVRALRGPLGLPAPPPARAAPRARLLGCVMAVGVCVAFFFVMGASGFTKIGWAGRLTTALCAETPAGSPVSRFEARAGRLGLSVYRRPAMAGPAPAREPIPPRLHAQQGWMFGRQICIAEERDGRVVSTRTLLLD